MEETNRWQNYVDRLIEEAQERGEFDYSSLKGKKLREDKAEHFAGDRTMAHKVLKNSGYAPDFIMKKRDIDEMLAKQRDMLLRYALRRRRLLTAAEEATEEEHRAALMARADEDWQWAIRRYEEAIPEINKQISIFNLMNKIPNLHKWKIRIEKEVERVEKQLEEL
ncbi:MAG: DUF1992 domain-containing protein [Chloroflexota bacterium]|nr:DUF1992 domain-containing protein [Chloroflexota bacterium]